jgi:hypothetical protein
MSYMFYFVSGVLAGASLLLLSVSLWFFVQWFQEKTYRPRRRNRI